MTVQLIEEQGRPKPAVPPIEEYEALREAAEMLADMAAYDRAKARPPTSCRYRWSTG